MNFLNIVREGNFNFFFISHDKKVQVKLCKQKPVSDMAYYLSYAAEHALTCIYRTTATAKLVRQEGK